MRLAARLIPASLTLALGLVVAPARARAGPGLRTSVAPSAGVGVRAGERLDVSGHVRVGVVADDPSGAAGQVGTYARVRLRGWVLRRLALHASYGYGHGRFYLDGPWRREHRGQVGLLARSLGRRVHVADRLAVDLRGVRDARWAFRVRLRNELRVTAVVHPAFQISLSAEGLLQPQDDPWLMLQTRTGLVLHGTIPVGPSSPRGRPRPEVGWLAALGLGTHPIAQWKGRLSDLGALGEPREAPPLELVVYLGVLGVF